MTVEIVTSELYRNIVSEIEKESLTESFAPLVYFMVVLYLYSATPSSNVINEITLFTGINFYPGERNGGV